MLGNALLTFTYITHCIDSLQESFYLRERENADIQKKADKIASYQSYHILSCAADWKLQECHGHVLALQ